MQSLWMIAASFLFACMGVCVKLASRDAFRRSEITFYRSFISLLMMYGRRHASARRAAVRHGALALCR
jgi:drug/metabolite transporter (DMT)-like permease